MSQLKNRYEKEVIPKLMEAFKYKNVMQVPRLKKIVLNMGLGEAIQNLKWTLITYIDDYSRMLLYADFVPEENTWAHIHAAQSVLQTFGLPFRYYVDNLRVFRFVQHRDSVWRTHHFGTDDVDPQWKQVLQEFKVKIIYALSPQAKGKVQRPYRWLQDRIVRTCALEKLSSM